MKDCSHVSNANRRTVKLFASCNIASDGLCVGVSVLLRLQPLQYLNVTPANKCLSYTSTSQIKFNVIFSFKNEEVLKKCAQEYLSRVKKEEQRYQALKIHAEEKLDR